MKTLKFLLIASFVTVLASCGAGTSTEVKPVVDSVKVVKVDTAKTITVVADTTKKK